MIRQIRRVIAVAFAAVCIVAPAQNNPSSQYHISGTVLNAATGAPVPAATVALLSIDDNHRIASTQSGNDGRFDSPVWPQRSMNSSSPSAASPPPHTTSMASSAPPSSQAKARTPQIIFRLVPGAVLHGVVTGDGGDPVEGASVLLSSKPQFHEPGAKIEQAETATPTTPALRVRQPRHRRIPARGHRVAMVRDAHDSRNPQSPTNPALDVAYPVAYFDSTTDEASASPIALTGGSRVEVNVTLHAVPALRIVVPAPFKRDGSSRPRNCSNRFSASRWQIRVCPAR